MAQGEWSTTTEFIKACIAILEIEHPMTVRQLFYRLISAEIIKNDLSGYQRVSRAMTKARGDLRVPYDWIVDRSRTTYRPGTWTSLSAMLQAMEYHFTEYRRDYWQDQPCYVEIISEKDAVMGSLDELRTEFGVAIRPVRGFDSTTKMQEAATHLLQQVKNGKKVVLLYVGDHDPSGRDIDRDIEARLRSYQLSESKLHFDDDNLEVRRLGIFKEDIAKFKLPPLEIKRDDDGNYRDPRAKAFVREHGEKCVELDALPPTELRRRIREAIEGLIEPGAWNRAKLVEDAQRETCKRYVEVFKEMQQ